MSTTLAGKFQDHYEVLGVEPKADSESIHRAYNTLAKRFHPGNKETGDPDKYAAVTQAYEVLADPAARRAFDTVRTGPEQEAAHQFSGTKFFDRIVQEEGRRQALLCVLYDRRQQNSFRPSLSNRQLEGILKITTEELNFAVWYLKQRNFVKADDKSSLHITVDGMDYLERHLPSIEGIQPFLKATQTPAAAPQPAAASDVSGPRTPAAAPAEASPKPPQTEKPATSSWKINIPPRTINIPKRG